MKKKSDLDIERERYSKRAKINKHNSINRFFKRDSKKHFPAKGEATLCGMIVDADENNGLAKSVTSFIYGGKLNNNT